MKLRFIADRRALFWALILFPALPALSYQRPTLALWLLPIALYLAYCAGALAHNHNHAPVFRGKLANSLYSAWLSFFYGCPLFVWVPTHNQNHHRYLDGPGDATRTHAHAAQDSLWAALSYPTRSAFAQAPIIWTYAVAAQRRHPSRFRQIVFETAAVAVGHGAALLLALHGHGPVRGALLYALALGIPAGFSAWSMMFTNYLQHVGCDHASPDNHSRNFVSAWLNWLVFHAGYHTVHHEHPGSHWSRYPALHALRAARIDARLKQRTIWDYCFQTYLRAGTGTPPSLLAGQVANAAAHEAS